MSTINNEIFCTQTVSFPSSDTENDINAVIDLTRTCDPVKKQKCGITKRKSKKKNSKLRKELGSEMVVYRDFNVSQMERMTHSQLSKVLNADLADEEMQEQLNTNRMEKALDKELAREIALKKVEMVLEASKEIKNLDERMFFINKYT